MRITLSVYRGGLGLTAPFPPEDGRGGLDPAIARWRGTSQEAATPASVPGGQELGRR